MTDFKLDHAGLGRFMRSGDMQRAMGRVGARVASHARTLTDKPVVTDTAVTDRAIAIVVIAHPGGAAEQAKRGTLTKALGAAGLEAGRR